MTDSAAPPCNCDRVGPAHFADQCGTLSAVCPVCGAVEHVGPCVWREGPSPLCGILADPTVVSAATFHGGHCACEDCMAHDLSAAWKEHDAPFGHCAGCGEDLPIQTGGDGDVIVSLGHCRDCGLTTMWHPVNLVTESAQSDGGSE